MKKLFIILCFLAIPSLVFAGGITDKHKAVIARINSAPVWATSVVFGWSGDMPQGTNYGFDSSGAPVAGVNSSLTIGTAYGESGSNGAHITNVDQYLEFTGYIDDTSAQTIWMRIYVSDAVLDGEPTIFEAYVTGNDLIKIAFQTNLLVKGATIAQGNSADAREGAVANGSWIDIAYSWAGNNAGEGTPTGDHDIYYTAWKDSDADELGYALSSTPATFMLGEELTAGTSPGDTEYINITQIAIVDGYKTAKPW